jgi:AcrR family transcriptional regulator
MTAHSTPPVKTLRADARRNRERVLESARVCFGKRGLETQMDDVAAHAGVGVGTVYRHFATKEALVDALAAAYFAREAALAEQALTVKDPWEAFAGFLRAGAEVLAENRALAQISADRPEVMRDAAFAADAEIGFFGTLDQLIGRAKTAGVLRPDFELEDIPAIMCSLGALQISPKGFTSWRRVLAFVLDGLHGPGGGELPPVLSYFPRGDV